MVFVTDMREGRTYLMKQGDCLDVYRAEGSGFEFRVFFSHFPSGAMNPDDFVDAFGGKGVPEGLLHTLEPHITLVAHPAPLAPRTVNVQAAIQTALFGLENTDFT